MRYLILILLLVGCSPIRVIDGDTFDYYGERVRISNIDTPELRGKCEEEKRLAQLAKNRLEQLLQAEWVGIIRMKKDRWGRTIARVCAGSLSCDDVGEVLISEGLAREWKGRREPWC